MTDIYLTESIILRDNKLYNEDKLIKNHNWHRVLNDYGWEKISKQWIRKLNKYSLQKHKQNSLFGILDCGGDGDCFFNCINNALKSKHIYDIEDYNLRELISNSINKEKFDEIINIYKILKDSDDFDEDWDPYVITIDEFKEKIKEGGNEYWCDHILLNILYEILNINIIILNNNEFMNEYYYYPLFHDYNETKETIILLYENNIHFKLIGHFNNHNMITLFTKETLPIEILRLINNRE